MAVPAAQGVSFKFGNTSFDRIWGNPFPELSDRTDRRALLLFEGLHQSITPDQVHRTIAGRISRQPCVVIGVLCQSILPHFLSWHGRAVVLMTGSHYARMASSVYDGASFMGKVIRVQDYKLSGFYLVPSDLFYLQVAPQVARLFNDIDLEASSKLIAATTTKLSEDAPTNLSENGPVFHSFPKLPSEIRIMIWKWHINSYTTPTTSRSATSIRHVEWLGCKIGFASRTPIPACLQINRESRFEADKIYQLTVGSKRAPKGNEGIRYHPDETLYFTVPRKYNIPSDWNAYGVGGLTLCRLFEQVSQTGLNRITAIAFDVHLWFYGNRKEKPKMSQIRLQLPSLRYIKIVLSQGLDSDRNGSAKINERPFGLTGATLFPQDRGIERYRMFRSYQTFTAEMRAEALLHPTWKKPHVSAWNITRGGVHEPYLID